DAHAAVGSADTCECRVQPPSRARKNPCQARVRIVAQRLDVELDREVAFEPECDLGPSVESEAAALPQAAVGSEQLDVLLDDRLEVRARHLLLASMIQRIVSGAAPRASCSARMVASRTAISASWW